MDTSCNICGQNSIIYGCNNCLIKGCDRCLNGHQASCELMRIEKCHLCKVHDQLVKGYCCTCCQLTCRDCIVDNHYGHTTISILEAFRNSENDFVKFQETQSKILSYAKTCKETQEIYHEIEDRIEKAEDEYQTILQEVKSELLLRIQRMEGQIDKQCEENDNIDPFLQMPNETAMSFPITFLSQFSESRFRLDAFQMRYFLPTDDLNSLQNIHQLFLSRLMELAGLKASSINTSDVSGVESLSSGLRNIGIRDEGKTEYGWHQSVVPDNRIEELKTNVDMLSLQISESEKEKTFMLQCLEELPKLVHQISETKELLQDYHFHPQEKTTMNRFIHLMELLINKMVEFKNQLIESEADVQKKISEMANFSRYERRETSDAQYEPNLKFYQTDIHFKEEKIKSLERELSDLKNRNCLLEQEAYRLKFNRSEQLHTVDSEMNDLKLRLETADKTNFQSEQEITALKNTIQQMQIARSQSDDLMNTMKREKDDIQNRLSKFAGEKLTKGNPAITDLGDPNRPMKLAEMYGGLYDNEWTDAMECSGVKSQNPETDEIIVRHLYKILTTCYEECLQLSKEQYMSIAQIIQCDSNQGENGISSLPGLDLASVRRQNSEKFAQYLLTYKIFHEKILTSPWDYTEKNTDLMKHLLETPFFAKCVKLCWLMVIQEPAMHLSENLFPDTVYDKNVYKEYVQSGDKVTYVVWPALFLHKNGPLLYKGVVQAHK